MDFYNELGSTPAKDAFDNLVEAFEDVVEEVIEEDITGEFYVLENSSMSDFTSVADFMIRAGVESDTLIEAMCRTLKWSGITNLGELRKLSRKALSSLKGIGERSIVLLVELMEREDITCLFVIHTEVA